MKNILKLNICFFTSALSLQGTETGKENSVFYKDTMPFFCLFAEKGFFIFIKDGDSMIGFIGSGRAARGLGLYFSSSGMKISGYFDKENIKSKEAANLTGTIAFESLNEIIESSKIIFISTGDDFIQEAGKELKNILGERKRIIAHLSGLHDSKMLKAIFQENPCCSLHPVHSFSGEKDDTDALAKVVFTLEGDEEAVIAILEKFELLENKIVRINSEDKVLYHGACVFASNYITTLIYKSMKIFNDIGISDKEAKQMFEPLVKGAIDNAFLKGPEKSLTGPVARGDSNTVLKHLNDFKKYDEETARMYKIIARETLELASKELLRDTIKINEIKLLLKD